MPQVSNGLFTPWTLGAVDLKSRIVMAPMTRSRCGAGNIPGDLSVEYYRQRAGAGLIVTEGTSPSPNGVGYARIPGLWSEAQVQGWKRVTDAVHHEGGRIFAQLMHTGRVGHPLSLPPGAEVLAPSAVRIEGDIYTDQQGMQPHPTPRAMTAPEVLAARDEYVKASVNAMKAGFDGVELHGANGYLIEQFISPQTNQRTDDWGGSIEKRLRFAVETARCAADAVGGDRVGIRLSPYGVNAGMAAYPEIDETYEQLVRSLVPTGLAYVHIPDHSSMGAPVVPDSIKCTIRKLWPRTLILCGGFDAATAQQALDQGLADLVAFGRMFISNPDLPIRMRKGWPLAAPDFKTFYTPGAAGYTDYPSYSV